MQVCEPDRFAANVLPVIRAIEVARIASFRGRAAALDARGGRWQVSDAKNVLKRKVAGCAGLLGGTSG